MPLTLLLDLDDTLLKTNTDVFIQAYFGALSKALNKYGSPEKVIGALIDGTKRMLVNQDPQFKLNEVFDPVFFQALDTSREELQSKIDFFYSNEYVELSKLTSPRSEAIELVTWAFENKMQVVIATNPLFPKVAVIERLRWAGLPIEKFPFEIVTSYDSFHFAKSPEYYAEILARLGWQDSDVVMVGDEPEMDIRAAKVLGISTFQISRAGVNKIAEADGYGSIGDVRAWLETKAETKLKLNSREAFLAVIRATPASISALIENAPAEKWKRALNSAEWGLNDLLCHFRDVDSEVNLQRINSVLNESNPFISGQLTDIWAEERGYDAQNGREAFDLFLETRKKILAILDALQPEDWARPARHAFFGPTTLYEIVDFICEHDRLHIQQMAKLLNIRA